MEEILNETVPEKVEVVDIQFRPGQKVYYFDPQDFKLERGMHVIVETSLGEEYAEVVIGNREMEDDKVTEPLKPVIRITTEKDEKMNAEFKAKEGEEAPRCI